MAPVESRHASPDHVESNCVPVPYSSVHPETVSHLTSEPAQTELAGAYCWATLIQEVGVHCAEMSRTVRSYGRRDPGYGTVDASIRRNGLAVGRPAINGDAHLLIDR